MMRNHIAVLATITALLANGCASLGIGIVAPRFEVANEQPSELRLLGPSLARPLGGASIRLYARVDNPNPIGITLTSLVGALRLEGYEAAEASFPLGLPLQPGQSTVVPLDIAVSFADFPGLADVVRRTANTGRVAYDLRGTVTVDAGSLGQPSFGPMTILQGSLEARR